MACNYYFGIGSRLRTLGEERQTPQPANSHADPHGKNNKTNNDEQTTAALVKATATGKKVAWDKSTANKKASKHSTAAKRSTKADAPQ